jgi:thioesterase domain-containing protein
VRLWRARESSLTALPLAPEFCAQVTRGLFKEEVLEGQHFELMHPPLVDALAARLTEALAKSKS